MIEYQTTDAEKFHQLMVALDEYFDGINVKNVGFERMLGNVIETGLCDENTSLYCLVSLPKKYSSDKNNVTLTIKIAKPMKTMQSLFSLIKESIVKMQEVIRDANLFANTRLELVPGVTEYSLVLSMSIGAKDPQEKIPYDAEYRFIVSKKQERDRKTSAEQTGNG
jgi:hypothetical protein